MKYSTTIALPRLGIQRDYLITERTCIVDKESCVIGVGCNLKKIYANSNLDQLLVDYIKNNNVDVFSVCWNGIEDCSKYFVVDNDNKISVISISDEGKDNGQIRHWTFEEFVYSDYFSEWLNHAF